MRVYKLPSAVLLIIFLFSNLSFSQEEQLQNDSFDSLKIKRINLGLKLGIPNVIGGSAEIILPLFGNRLSPFFDYSGFNIETSDLETDFFYMEYGTNIYLSKKGKGFFVSIGQAKFDTELTFKNLNFSDGNQSLSGTGSTDFNFNTANLKLGVKTGGTLYFRFEVGYGFGNIPDTIDFTATSNGITDSFSEEIPPIPGLNKSGILIGNIGFGLAF